MLKQERMPLDGVRVLDLTRLVAGNMMTLQFGDLGADVIKVEQPGRGDPLRAWRHGGMDLWWREYGRNKRSIALDFSAPSDHAALLALIDRTDILCENFIPGGLSKWNLSHDILLERNPGLVIVSITGWGQTGPYASRPGFGTLVEAMSGLAAMTGFPDRPPTMPPIPIADMVAGLYAAFSAMVALRHRDLTGQGQVVDISLLEPIFSVLGPLAAAYTLTGKTPQRRGNRSPNNAPRNTYLTRDGEWVVISVSTPAMAEKFLRVFGLGHLLKDPKFSTHEARVENGDEIDAIVIMKLAEYDLVDLLAIFEREGLAGAPVLDVSQLLTNTHVRERGVVVTVEDPDYGAYPMHAVVPRFSLTPGRIRSVGPRPDQNRAEILGELNLPDAKPADEMKLARTA
ncbi:CoA transferase [Agrobacterium vitis]|uniref:CaiB/BaiF CoA transferase family protein n=1 Tax=Rhizobium/Agrobacterium group TaxID=227290 RepID=UPI0008FB6D62|nr:MULTISPECIES: CoA transferase [Rhizobium/Agrobacterium group]MCF1436910.1 CoA transferase [Allorhizobium ampelinum]MUO92441.1 CoA transferase [Agrobacterium vitis]MUZ55613.1 CoA transferase [Agrobacterium vitis]MUZ94837.1 CoA transferase [Agrobacterium vitis]MVA43235.1 CoA transferase [Agrobacterium vitis]